MIGAQSEAPAEERLGSEVMPRFPPEVPQNPSSGNPSNRILLFGFGGYGELVSSGSSFCTKLETYLRFQGIDYDAEPAQISAAPKGKVRYSPIHAARTVCCWGGIWLRLADIALPLRTAARRAR